MHFDLVLKDYRNWLILITIVELFLLLWWLLLWLTELKNVACLYRLSWRRNCLTLSSNREFKKLEKDNFRQLWGFPGLKGTSGRKISYAQMKESEKWKKKEPSLTSMRQMVLEISHPKVRNLSKVDVAILEVFSLIFTLIWRHRRNLARQWKNESAISQQSFVQFVWNFEGC